MKPQDSGPFADAMGFTIKSNELVRAPVLILLPYRRPPNIPWSVVTFVIDAVDAMFSRWSSANMLKKNFVALVPFSAKGNTPTAIVGIMFIGGVQASHFDSYPSHIFRRSDTAFCLAMSADAFCPACMPTILSATFCNNAWLNEYQRSARKAVALNAGNNSVLIFDRSARLAGIHAGCSSNGVVGALAVLNTPLASRSV
jgi:hypothetical protein